MYPASDYVYNISKNFNHGTAVHPFGMDALTQGDFSPPSQAYPSGGPVVQWHDNGFAAMGQQQQGSEGHFFGTRTQHYTHYYTPFDEAPRYLASIPTLLRHLSEFYEQDARATSIRAQRGNDIYTQMSLPPESSMDLSRPVRCSDVTVPPLSEPAWPIDKTLNALNKNLADILARRPPLSTSHTSTSTLAPAQHLLPQQDDVGYQYGTIVTDGLFGTNIAVTAVHSEAANQPYAFDHQNTTGQFTSSKPTLVELKQAQVSNHGQSSSSQYSLQYSFHAYKSESGLDQALVEVQSSAVTAVLQPVTIASGQTSQESFQPYGGGSSLDMALVERPSPASTVALTPARTPTSTTTNVPSIQSAPASTMHAQPAMIPTSTSTNSTPSSQSVPVPTRKRKAGTDEGPIMSASAPSSSAPRKKRKSTSSSPKPRQPPRPRYFPSTSSYRPIESRLPAMVPEQVEGYQRLPRDPNASVYDMLGIPTSVGRPGSRHGPFTPRSKEDSRRS
ncbi:hypothetical protein CVT26_013100 [Gymnopilus dilepis]|uniref:Uncharacterized protein n=1 Tax=Gymnopilus dilepis TaxID=231916 RepID=A0A409YFA7_9AGAR|nr:hypothetical protein CVT26_013100 [Gymnopilus dilepis]